MSKRPKWVPTITPPQPSAKQLIEQMMAQAVAEASEGANELAVKEVRYITAEDTTLRVTTVSHSEKLDRGEITIVGKEADIRQLERMMMGVQWARRGDAGIETEPTYHRVPDLIDDPKLKEHWPTEPTVTPGTRFDMFVDDAEREKQARAKGRPDTRSIYVSGVQVYAPASVYSERATMLKDAGFICMRSQRDDAGKFWETWYLPGPYAAKGPVENKTTDEIVNWLMKSVGPGSISVEGVHWGAVVD